MALGIWLPLNSYSANQAAFKCLTSLDWFFSSVFQKLDRVSSNVN